MTNQASTRIIFILLFALLFTTVGWAMPVIYASYVPADEVVEVHSFKAENVSTPSTHHSVCLNRTVHNPSSGESITELYLIQEGANQKIDISSKDMDRYFRKGQNTVVTTSELPESIEPGKYQYLLVIRMEMANGRVTRDFVFESEQFTVESGLSDGSTTGGLCT